MLDVNNNNNQMELENQAPQSTITMPDIRVLQSVEFEVFGHVQGCSFTKYIRDLCKKSAINGWVKNSKQGTIVGKMQGPKVEIDKMINWLANTGSPGSQIERVDLSNWKTLSRYDYTDYSIRF